MSRPATARLFIALDLPDALRAELAGWARAAVGELSARERLRRGARAGGTRDQSRRNRDQRQAYAGHRGSPERARGSEQATIRLIEQESLHLTICFLGSVPVEAIEPLRTVVERCEQPVGECSLGAPLWLPPRRPRALAVEVHDDERTLSALHAALLEAVELAGIPAGNAAGPHGRASAHTRAAGGRARGLRPHVTVARMRAKSAPRERALAPTPQRTFVPERLTLYRSWLGKQGASYEALADCATRP